MLPLEMVMNNKDLRGIIFSYFRKKPEKICVTCQRICVWNKEKFRDYTDFSIDSYSITLSQCNKCNHWHNIFI
jgi:hypothetical protein